MIKLDYSITDPAERNELVKKILEENPEPNEKYLEILANYLILCMEKQEKKEKKILTENHMQTVNKRETSFEGLVAQLENGEDGIYNLIHEDKYQIFQPKVTITKKDLETIPFLQQLKDAIDSWDAKLKTTEGKNAFLLKKAIIEMRKDQYIIKNAYLKPITFTKISHGVSRVELPEEILEFDKEGFPIVEGKVSLLNPKCCSAILCNYSKLKQDSWDILNGDLKWMMMDFDRVCEKALKDYPLYEKIVIYKIDGKQNVEIQQLIQEEFGFSHSIEYISSLWRNKIPKLIAAQAEDDYLNWYYTFVEYGKYKKCSRCGEIKLAHNKYFSKNKTSKDGFYSICKCCRNSKGKKA